MGRRRTRRSRPRSAGALALLVALAAAAPATAATRAAPTVLHPRFRLEGRFTDLVASDRYVALGLSPTTFRLRDEQTGQVTTITAPCRPAGGASPVFGGPYLMFGCNGEAALYAPATGSWRTVPISATADCAAASDCSATATRAGAAWLQVGETWDCMEHGCANANEYVNLATGALASPDATAGTGPGSELTVDLDSPTLTRRLCAPLRVPRAGGLIPEGRFTIAEAFTEEQAFRLTVERCGSHRQVHLGPLGAWTANDRVVLWESRGPGSDLSGVRDATGKRFTVAVPRRLRRLTGWLFDLSAKRLYVLDTGSGRTWSTAAPTS